MFKLALALVAVGALAADTEAPVISLDESMTVATASTSPYHVSKQAFINKRKGAVGPASPASHFANECKMSANACKLPSATAYDHHDGVLTNIDIEVDLFVVGKPCDAAGHAANQCKPKEDNVVTTTKTTGQAKPDDSAFGSPPFKTRAEYVMTYDVADTAGNAAEQLRFALIVVDDLAPTVSGNANKQTFELSAHVNDYDQAATLNANLKATDNVDNKGLLLFDGKLSSTGKWTAEAGFPQGDKSFSNHAHCIKPKTKNVKVQDFAYIFGKGYKSNVLTTQLAWDTTDSRAPYLAPRDDTVCMGCGQKPSIQLSGANFHINWAFSAQARTKVVEVTDSSTFNGQIECGDQIKNYYKFTGKVNEDLFQFGSKPGFQDDGDMCRGQKPIVTMKNDWTNTYHSGDRSLKLTFTAKDHHTAIANEEKGWFINYKVVDTTPPRVAHNVAHMTGNKAKNNVGTGTFNDNKDYTNSHTSGQSLYSGNAKNTNLGYGENEQIIQHSAGYEKDVKQITKWIGAFSCHDDCAPSSNAKTANKATGSTEWFKVDADTACDSLTNGHAHATGAYTQDKKAVGGGAFDITEVGTYVLKYTCEDTNKLQAAICRTVFNVDHTRPVLDIVPTPECRSKSRACACRSWRDRTNIRDGSCVNSHPNDNYVDAGATCSDQVDDYISELVEVSGQVVDLNTPDTYQIKYNCKDTAGNEAIEMTRTVYVIDAVCPTCFINWNCDGGATDKWGACVNTVEASFPYVDGGAKCESGVQGDHDNVYSWDNRGNSFEVLCETGSKEIVAKNEAGVGACVNVEKLGTYTLTYKYTDESGNNNVDPIDDGTPGIVTNQTCNEYKTKASNAMKSGVGAHQYGIGYNNTNRPPQVRTVVVADRLQPIIYLQDSIIKGEMEQTSTANGWVIAAVASAITGVALISLSTRSNAVTSVPV
jgi:hypothetical protein